MKRLAIAILAVALSLAGLTGCAMFSDDESEGWTAQDEGQSLGGGDIGNFDPEIEARAEMY